MTRKPALGWLCALLCLLVVASCTDSSTPSTSSGVAAPTAFPTNPPGAPPTAATVAPTTTIATTTTTISPANTIPHGDGPISVTFDGKAIDEDAAATAKSVYAAAIQRDYDRLRDIIGDRRFRFGYIGERRPTEKWRKDYQSGGSDALAQIVLLLDTPPAVDKRGNITWPYLAVKDPETWDDADLVTLAKIGFNAEDVEATKAKGVYKDLRLVIDSQGIWTTFAVGF